MPPNSGGIALMIGTGGKFAHGIFRSAALLKWSIERRQPNRLQLGDD